MATDRSKAQQSIPLYLMVKQHILGLLESGEWEEGKRLPSENELVEELSVSRMTVNRALRELAAENYVERISGVGTFVAQRKVQSHPLEIQNIAEEILSRGHQHTCTVEALEEVRASAEMAMMFDLAPGSRLFYSLIVHCESDMPIQFEERFVLPEFAPEYLEQDFSQHTTNEYLMGLNQKLEQVEQIVQAAMPNEATRLQLQMGKDEPCLLLLRRTWVKQRVVTSTRLHHPASRYQFGSRYQP